MDEEQKRLAEELLSQEHAERSFAKSLFFGDFDASQVFPYPQPKVNQKFLDEVAQFAKDEVDPVVIDRDAALPDSVVEKLKSLGVMGMTVPKEYGGGGMSQHEYCKVTEILAARCASTALFVNVHQSIGLKALILFGTDEQKKQWLPKMASGEVIGAFALTEPNAGSDASAVETYAEYDAEKDIYRINGKKQWITNGSIAGVLTLMAQTGVGAEKRVTAFLVTPDMPGFKITERSLEKVGFRGTWTANLAFENMEVPAANILGQKGKGLKVALSVLDYGRTTFGANCTGIARFLLDLAIEHAKTRQQFKRPLASFGLVKKKIAEMSALVYAMDATTYMTAGLIDKGIEDIMLESTMLKVFASDALWSIIYDTMQIFGGRSLFKNAPFERTMRDARLNMIGEGSNEVMRAFIATVGMRDVGLSLKNDYRLQDSPWSNKENLYQFILHLMNRYEACRVTYHNSKLKNEAKALGKGVRRLGFAVLRVLAAYREEVVEHQMDLDRISTSVMALYTATSVLSKLEADGDFVVGRYYCHMAMKQLNNSLDHLFDKDDAITEYVSDSITGLM